MNPNEAPEGTTLISTGLAEGPWTPCYRRFDNGTAVTEIKTVYEWEGGKWEGFTAVRTVTA